MSFRRTAVRWSVRATCTAPRLVHRPNTTRLCASLIGRLQRAAPQSWNTNTTRPVNLTSTTILVHRRPTHTRGMDRKSEVGSKRKHPPATDVDHRPAKQIVTGRRRAPTRSQPPPPSPPPPAAMDSNSGSDSEEVAVMPLPVVPSDSAEWQATIEAVIKTVVSIRFCQTCAFDTDGAAASEATGFVVDAERGYILTNRHVACAGPFWGYCVFDNHEECDVYPVYRDPVHDFGFLRFDPSAIKYMPVTALNLRPELARVGAEIRVVGNDAGEKLSILSGVISRLDRNTPDYGEGYCDFNTNYIQAAAAASGGSSGSPVVNVDGHAVALQAGGRTDGAATDYFLPLDRPARALDCLQHAQPITRGTLQVHWLIKPFDECRRLGLTSETEGLIREGMPRETGMLVAELVLPEGPAHGQIEEGDVLIRVEGELLTQLIRLGEILDANVGQKVRLTVQRGGRNIETRLDVGDLHAITPDRFVSVGGGSFHNLSYQVARLYAVPVRGVYCCEADSSFRLDGAERGCLILSVDQKQTPDLDAFIAAMKAIPDRSRVVVTYKHLDDLHTVHTSILYVDRHWTSKMRMLVRNDETGKWDVTNLADPLPPTSPEPQRANFIRLDSIRHPAVADVIRSFVRISCNMPILIDGFPRSMRTGFGLVVDAEKGLVVVSRAIVPFDLCDIFVTVADSIIVDGQVVFMHPLQNYAIIRYDPSLVQAPVKSAKLSETTIKQGAEIMFLGFNQNLRVAVANTTVTDITAVAIPIGASPPRYRAINVDAITVDTSLAGQCGSGVLVAQDGTVEALWLTYFGERSSSTRKDIEYHLGLASPTLLSVIRQLQDGEEPRLRILSMESQTIQMSQARLMGVSEEMIQEVERANPERHQLFMVRKVACGHDQSPSDSNALMEGDVLLKLNGKLITRVSELDVMYDQEVLDALILRNRQEVQIQVPTVPTEDLETDHVVVFCGAVLHRPHHAVRQQISKLHSEIYVSARVGDSYFKYTLGNIQLTSKQAMGSPAYQYGLVSTNFITAVNGIETVDLPSFIKEVVDIPDNTYFRLKLVTFDNVPWVVTMKKNDHYFPMMELIKDASERCGWKRQTYDHGRPSAGVDLGPEITAAEVAGEGMEE